MNQEEFSKLTLPRNLDTARVPANVVGAYKKAYDKLADNLSNYDKVLKDMMETKTPGERQISFLGNLYAMEEGFGRFLMFTNAHSKGDSRDGTNLMEYAINEIKESVLAYARRGCSHSSNGFSNVITSEVIAYKAMILEEIKE